MKILALNTGSSSIKFALYEFPDEKVLVEGQFKNHAKDQYSFEITTQNTEEKIAIQKKDFEYAVDFLFDHLQEKKCISRPEDIDTVVHRIVHGGEEFTGPTELTQHTIEKIKVYNDFAPLHNPPALKKVRQLKETYPDIVQYGAFDTSFHLSNPKKNYLYGLPYGYYENLGVRRFGFHGISYAYIIQNLEFKNKDKNDQPEVDEPENYQQEPHENVIVCHLGSGSSVCAIQNGKSVDHSFGFTPDENLLMATRVGEVDYDAVQFVKNKLNLSEDDVEQLLNKESGLLGVSGYTKDMKKLVDDYEINERAQLAVDMYIKLVVDYIARFAIQLGGVDQLIFTGGIGEGSFILREMICKKLALLDIKLDNEKNSGVSHVESSQVLSDAQSSAEIFVMHTNETLQMARNIFKLKNS